MKLLALLRKDASLLNERGVGVLALGLALSSALVAGERDGNTAAMVAAEPGSSLPSVVVVVVVFAPPAPAAAAAAATAFCLASPPTILLENDFFALCRATRGKEGGEGYPTYGRGCVWGRGGGASGCQVLEAGLAACGHSRGSPVEVVSGAATRYIITPCASLITPSTLVSMMCVCVCSKAGGG